MALFQFACPHCSGQFQVQDPPAGEAIACPHCGRGVALPAELPPPADVVEAPPDLPLPTDGITLPFDVHEPPTPSAAQPSRASAQVVRPPARAPLSREERERRRTIRNLLLMLTGLVVLVVAALVLSRL
jgi:hypothetical protein